tara:strand:- start:195 stop:698 length:504 start_codon:yes stop_codon:yes gene_type:complete
MTAFDQAWTVLKALPEQQGFTMREQLPTLYGQDMTEAPSFSFGSMGTPLQQRRGTIHPAILGMMERRQDGNMYMPFPDRRLEVESPNFDMPEPTAKRYGTIMAQGLRNEMTGDTSDDDLTDAAQRERGSVFDSGYYNPYGLPMVGVRQPNYKENRMPVNYELNRRRY